MGTLFVEEQVELYIRIRTEDEQYSILKQQKNHSISVLKYLENKHTINAHELLTKYDVFPTFWNTKASFKLIELQTTSTASELLNNSGFAVYLALEIDMKSLKNSIETHIQSAITSSYSADDCESTSFSGLVDDDYSRLSPILGSNEQNALLNPSEMNKKSSRRSGKILARANSSKSKSGRAGLGSQSVSDSVFEYMKTHLLEDISNPIPISSLSTLRFLDQEAMNYFLRCSQSSFDRKRTSNVQGIDAKDALPSLSWVRIVMQGGRELATVQMRTHRALQRFVTTLSGYSSVTPFSQDRNLLLIESARSSRRASGSFLAFDSSSSGASIPRRLQRQHSRSSRLSEGSMSGGIMLLTPSLAEQRQRERPELAGAMDDEEALNAILCDEFRRMDQDWQFGLLQRFSRITHVVRAAQKEFGEAFLEGKKPGAPSSSTVADALENSGMSSAKIDDTLQNLVEAASPRIPAPTPLKLDADDVCPRVPVSRNVWASSFTDYGALVDSLSIQQAIFDSGVAPEARELVWPFILNVYGWTSSRFERENILSSLVREYKTLTRRWQRSILEIQRRGELPDGVLGSMDSEKVELELSVLGNGEDDDGVDAHIADLVHIDSECEDETDRKEKLNAQVLEMRTQIIKDVVRTDRSVEAFHEGDEKSNRLLSVMERVLSAYAMKNEELSYCQGMSDFLAPLIHAFFVEREGHDVFFSPQESEEQEALVFGCFSQLMIRVGANFLPDQSGIRAQLSAIRRLIRIVDRDLFAFFEEADPSFYSVYRWILVQFKREVEFSQIARMWEIFWLDHVAPKELHIYVVVAILCAQRECILSLPECAFDQILHFVNGMSKQFDPEVAVKLGAKLYLRIGRLHGEVTAPRFALSDIAISPATMQLLF